MDQQAKPPDPIILTLPHGGSGSAGNSAYANRAAGCVERIRLDADSPKHCEHVYKPTATGPNAMLVGSMVHSLIEHEAKHCAGPIPAATPVHWVDEECQWDPPEDAQTEARRIYDGWVPVRTKWDDAELIGAELLVHTEIEGIKISGLIDRLVIDPDGIVCLEDIKTARASGDIHSRGRTRLQMHLYTMAAWANGHDVQRIRVRQIVKTKVIKEELFETVDLPTPAREAWVLRYLRGALEREARGADGPRGAECDWCPHQSSGACKL